MAEFVVWTSEARPTQPKLNTFVSQLPATALQRQLELGTTLRELLKALGIRSFCGAIVIDGDMAVNLTTHFSNERRDTRTVRKCADFLSLPNFFCTQGTHEFMSDERRTAMEHPAGSYLQSPRDDILAFFYLAQWAAIFNQSPHGSSGTSMDALRLRVAVARSDALLEILRIRPTSRIMQTQYSAFLLECHPLLRAWWTSLEERRLKWGDMLELVCEQESDAYPSMLYMCFVQIGYEGVADFLRLWQEHRTQFRLQVI